MAHLRDFVEPGLQGEKQTLYAALGCWQRVRCLGVAPDPHVDQRTCSIWWTANVMQLT